MFLSEEFKQFCVSNGISHVTSPAYHPASNGQAESYVKVVKKGIKSCLMMSTNSNQNNKDLLKYLFDYRNSVHTTTGYSPAELVFGRKLRSRLDYLVPGAQPAPSPSSSTLAKAVERNQCSQSKAYGGINKQCFEPGDKVMYKKYNVNKKITWIRGEVIKRMGRMTYLIKDCQTLVKLKKHKNQLVSCKGPDNTHDNIVDCHIDSEDLTPHGATVSTSFSEENVNESRSNEGGSEDAHSTKDLTPTDVQLSDAVPPVENEEFFEASEDNTDPAAPEPQQEAGPCTSGGLSDRVLRPPRRNINYKPFFCID